MSACCQVLGAILRATRREMFPELSEDQPNKYATFSNSAMRKGP
jgi:hypothetical protein